MPTIELTAGEKKYFDRIIAEKAKIEWTDHKADMAALLARIMCRVFDDGEDKKANIANIIALRRSLGLHSARMDGEIREVAKRREALREMEQETAIESDLLAQPLMN